MARSAINRRDRKIDADTNHGTTDGLGVYWGSFLVDVKPLEMSFNACRRCHYCFATANKPQRQVNANQIFSLLQNYPNRSTFVSQLLQWRYPICLSNHTDPLDNASFAVARPVIETLVAMAYPFGLQTKGATNDRIFEWLLETLEEPTHIYMTITTLDEAIARKQEPGAPSPRQRLQQAKALTQAGHKVCFGINPAVPEWCGDPEPLVAAMKDAGGEGVWVEAMHFTPEQVKMLQPRDVEAIGADLLNRVKKRGTSPLDLEYWERCRTAVTDAGMEVQSVGNGTYSKYFEIQRSVHSVTYPTLQDFVNYCFENAKPYTLIPFEVFEGVLMQYLPEGIYSIGHHMGSMAYQVWEGSGGIANRMSYRTLLYHWWKTKALKTCPVNAPCFSWAVLNKGNDTYVQLLDDAGMPLLVFIPEGTDQLYTDMRPHL